MDDPLESFRAIERAMRPIRETQAAVKQFVKHHAAARRDLDSLAALRYARAAAEERRRICQYLEDEGHGARALRRFAGEQAQLAQHFREERTAAQHLRQLSIETTALNALYREARAFGEQSVQQYVVARKIADDASAIADIRRWAAISADQRVLDADTLSQVQIDLSGQLSDGSDLSLAEAIWLAVARTFARSGKPVDSRFIFGIVLTLLMFLQQELTGYFERKAADIAEQTQDVVLARQRQIIRAVLTKQVDRRARLRTRPSAYSRVLGTLDEGTAVVVMARRNKWTFVLIVGSAGTQDSPRQGWLLNKYLR